MPVRHCAAAVVLLATFASPHTASAFTGPGGCSSLPEYYRALGTLQGMESACQMSMAEASRIVAAYQGGPAVDPQAPVEPHRRYRHYRATRP